MGLMATLSLLPPRSRIIMPAFTFSATYQAALWNGLSTTLVECDDTCNIDPAEVEKVVTPDTKAIVAVHMYGTPANVDQLEQIARRHELLLFFDAAHAFGSLYKGRPLGGGGDAEVFSLGPTKTLPVGEGGIVSTNREELAMRIRTVCNHGQPEGSLDSMVRSFNGRLEEINAIIGSRALRDVEKNVIRRNELAFRYRRKLEGIPGISFPSVPEDCRSTFKDYCVFVDEGAFGMNRDRLMEVLAAKGIQTKRYFHPPVHQLTVAEKEFAGVRLPRTEWKSSHVLALPLYSHMPFEDVDVVCREISSAQR